ncbi:MAG: hypothetical protein P0Y55_00995 [Candidatus Cohnella colombiensis]|uniref:Uncharacterized protein n=1 Tax=Candidatus Cohnella colombiensis TaxID=3121368 RepID=A0AA95JG93_9BACL|nr:MAG: hypothetical protein P0Y55_00995 [Cohnella sp.]
MLALGLEEAKAYVHNKLSELQRMDLQVQIEGKSIVISSYESNERIRRVLFTSVFSDEYTLCFCDHRGMWQLLAIAGPLPQMLEILLNEFDFVLSRQAE